MMTEIKVAKIITTITNNENKVKISYQLDLVTDNVLLIVHFTKKMLLNFVFLRVGVLCCF